MVLSTGVTLLPKKNYFERVMNDVVFFIKDISRVVQDKNPKPPKRVRNRASQVVHLEIISLHNEFVSFLFGPLSGNFNTLTLSE